MDIEIIINGGDELMEFYPKNYEKFVEKIGDLILDMFPGVSGWGLSTKPTHRAQEAQKRREAREQEEFCKTLIEVLKKPEFQEIIRQRIEAGPTPAS
jgi:hypothetical protein